MGTEGLLSGARRPPPQASGKRDPKGSVDHSRGRLRALIFSEALCRLAVSLRLPAAPLGFLGFGGKTLKAQGGRLGERKSLLVRQQMMSRDWCRVAGEGVRAACGAGDQGRAACARDPQGPVQARGPRPGGWGPLSGPPAHPKLVRGLRPLGGHPPPSGSESGGRAAPVRQALSNVVQAVHAASASTTQ